MFPAFVRASKSCNDKWTNLWKHAFGFGSQFSDFSPDGLCNEYVAVVSAVKLATTAQAFVETEN